MPTSLYIKIKAEKYKIEIARYILNTTHNFLMGNSAVTQFLKENATDRR